MGLLLLGERLNLPQWLGIAAVIIASLGTTLGDRRAEPPQPLT
jgi:inner membrane transporter RhtA